MDDMIAIPRPGDEELGRRLTAFAEARLSPDAAAMARMRADLVASAGRRLDRPAPARTEPLRRTRTRRATTALLAATVTIAVVAGTVGAARPGGPIYAVRLWVENATLPGEPAARSAAELGLLETRLHEAGAAGSVGDHHGVAAALDAYRSILADAIAIGPGSDEALEAALTRHLVVLRTLETSVPEQARAAIEGAISSSSETLDQIAERRGGGPASEPGPGSGPGEHGPEDPPSSGRPDQPPQTGAPSEPPGQTKPDRTPNPRKPSEQPGQTKP